MDWSTRSVMSKGCLVYIPDNELGLAYQVFYSAGEAATAYVDIGAWVVFGVACTCSGRKVDHHIKLVLGKWLGDSGPIGYVNSNKLVLGGLGYLAFLASL